MIIQAKICAVVVTYNRLELLKLCIESLKKQTRTLDEILIINNSSTDGTEEWLKKQNDLIFITQENTGGAGGFHTGIKTAYEKGFDWIWCMDDDVYPEIFSLDKINEFTRTAKEIIAGVCCKRIEKNSTKLFKGEIIRFNPTGIRNSNRFIIGNDEFYNSPYCQLFSCTFEGFCINRNAVEIVGFPRNDFFIWYDDLEYCKRLLNYGKIFLLSDALMYKADFQCDENEISKTELMKWNKRLYGLRNLIFLETQLWRGKDYPVIPKYLSLLLYSLKYVLTTLQMKITLTKKNKMIICGCKMIWNGYFGKLGNLDNQ